MEYRECKKGKSAEIKGFNAEKANDMANKKLREIPQDLTTCTDVNAFLGCLYKSEHTKEIGRFKRILHHN